VGLKFIDRTLAAGAGKARDAGSGAVGVGTAGGRISLCGFLGATLVLLGGGVMLGWWLQLPSLVRVLPQFTPMVFNTALAFALAGCALLAPFSDPGRHLRVTTVAGGILVALAALVLAEQVVDLGIDWASLHGWLHYDNPHQGRMPAIVATGFLLTGAALVLVPRVRRPWTRMLARGLIVAVGAIGLLALAGYAVNASVLFPQYVFGQVALHTAAGLLLLAFGLRAFSRRFEWSRTPVFERENDRITAVGATVLALTALVVGTASFAILQDRVQGLVHEQVHAALVNRSQIFQDLILQRELNAQSAALRPAAARNLRVIRAGGDDGSNLANIKAVVDSFLKLDFSAIAYADLDGRVVASGGRFALSPAIAAALATPAGAELLWHDGLMLRHRFPVHDSVGKVGEVLVEQPLPVLTRLVQTPAGSGATWDIGLCVRRDQQLHCFPQRLNKQVFFTPLLNVAGELLPMTRALRGETGTTISRDYRAQTVLAAYGPVGDLGLGMVVKVDAAEVFGPIREQLQRAVGILLAVVAGGTLLLRSQVRPLATRLEGALEERAAGLHRAQQVAKLAHVITRPDGAFDAWSETLPELIGVRPSDVPRETREWLDILHPDDRALFRSKAIEAGVKGARTEVEYRLRRGDGAWIHLRQTMEPLGGDAQADTGRRWFNTLQDVTERKHSEEKIRHLNRVYAVLSGINSMIVRVRDRDELFREACRIAVEQGELRTAYIGLVEYDAKRVRTVACAGDNQEFARLDRPLGPAGVDGKEGGSSRAVRSKRPVINNDILADQATLTYPEEALRLGYRSVASFPLIVGDHAVGIFGLFGAEPGYFDADEVHLLEELAGDIAFAVEHLDLDLRMKQRTAELSESERRYSDLLGNVQLLSVMLDREARITYCNEYLLRLTGWRLEEVIGRSWVELFIPPSSNIKDRLAVLFADRADGRHGDNEILTRSGERRLIRWNNSVLRSGAGEVIGLASIGEDITERKRAELEIQELNASLEMRVAERTAQLEAANKELEAFSYSVSHDLRAPLRHIDGFAQMLREDCAPALDASGRRYLGVITDSVKQMGQLIDDLLLFSKMGRAEMHQAEVSMDELVQEVVQSLAGETGDRSIEWRIEPLPEVHGDRAMLKQVWANLLSNSVKYTRLLPQAKIGIGFNSTSGEFFVQDNGAGFDMTYAGKLFGVFQRLHRAEEFEGTGVGLANVQRIITRHGGRIRAQGKVNEGATFHFNLPLQQGSNT
jgi:PAS domain S-box-containing protein